MRPEEFKKRFPNLAGEMERGVGKADLTLRFGRERRFAGYEPTAVDFIRRCRRPEEAHEIIDYLEARGELSGGEAQAMRLKLEKEGLKSFGPHKAPGYYEREDRRQV